MILLLCGNLILFFKLQGKYLKDIGRRRRKRKRA